MVPREMSSMRLNYNEQPPVTQCRGRKLDWLKDVIYTLSQAPGARLIFEYYEVQRFSVMV